MSDLLEALERGSSLRGRFHFGDRGSATTAELWGASAGAGVWLRGRVGSNGSVGMLLSASAGCLRALVGGWRAGLQVLSVPLPGRGQPIEDYGAQLASLLRSAGAELLLCDADYAPFLAGFGFEVNSYVEVEDQLGQVGNHPGSFVQFSSGTTADPAGLVFDLMALGGHVERLLEHMAPRPGDASCSWLPLSHDLGLVGFCLVPWAGGARRWARGGDAVLLRPEDFLSDPSSWLRWCTRARATITGSPVFGLDLASRSRSRWGGVELSRLRTVVVGAEPLRARPIGAFVAQASEYGLQPDAVVGAYGLAEVTLAATIGTPGPRVWWSPGQQVYGSADPPRDAVVGSGQPLPGIELGVVRGGEGGSAELLVRSPHGAAMALGGRPLADEDGWVHTGDRGHLAEGQLFVEGRLDDQLEHRGRRVDGSALAAAVREVVGSSCGPACAFIDDEGRLAVVAEVKQPPRVSDAVLRREVARACGSKPEVLHLVAPGTMPLTSSGKPQRRFLGRVVQGG